MQFSYFVIFIFFLNSSAVFAQINCNNHTTGLPPITDLGSGFWAGRPGGLYPGGSNERPADHTTAGLGFTANIEPLDINGNPDAINGKIVLAGVGMSNTRLEFEVFENLVDTFSNKNPQLEVVTTSINRHDLNIIVDSTHVYWDSLYFLLEERGLSYKQVQAIWFKEARAFPNENDTTFSTYMDTLVSQLVTCMHIIHNRYPNCRMVYISSRIYGDYQPASFRLNPEPFAYYNGWGIKDLIERQLNNDPELAYDGIDAKAPWLSWGPYLWADGINPRSDGLTWDCPDDFKDDGAHPSEIGSEKVANYLIDFFSTDETTVPWFTDNPLTGTGEELPPAIISDFKVNNYPNPFNGSTIFTFILPEAAEIKLSVHNLAGQQVALIDRGYWPAGTHKLNWEANLASGIYFYRLFAGGKQIIRKFALVK